MSKFIKIADTDTDRDIMTSSGYSLNASNKRASDIVKFSRISVANVSSDTATISLYVYEVASPNTEHYLIKNLEIPASTTFIWDDPISFNISTHKLRMFNSGSNPSLTVIID